MNKLQFKEVFDAYFDTIRRFIYYRCGNEEKASDIAQDVFLAVWEKRDKLDGDNIKSLLYKMASDMVISDLRKVVVRQNFAKGVVYFGSEVSVHDELQFEETQRRYAEALDEMPEQQRVTFLLSRNDELKYSEIAEMLNISVKAVEKRMSLALQFLRQKLLDCTVLLIVLILSFLKGF